jgi:hypothetical protein
MCASRSALQLSEPLAIGRQARHHLLGKIEALVLTQRRRVRENVVIASGHG